MVIWEEEEEKEKEMEKEKEKEKEEEEKGVGGGGDESVEKIGREHGRRGGGRERGGIYMMRMRKQREGKLTRFEQFIAFFESQAPHATGASLRGPGEEA